MLTRALSHVLYHIKLSDKKFHKENLKIVEQILKNNVYSKKFIKHHINKRLQYHNKNTDTNTSIEGHTKNIHNQNEITIEKRFVVIPYVNDTC